ncbi:MAG: enoyl-CoA hydratase/isomerase family protein [Bacillota bacterium]
MELSTVSYQVEESVAVICMNRLDAMNALNQQLFVDLTTAFEEAKKDDAVRVVIFSGNGRCFCAGGDIAEMKGLDKKEPFVEFMTIAGNFTKLLYDFPKPVIAAAHGAIAGAGTSLMMCCDMAIVSDDAKFIVAFGAVGLIPDCGLHYLLPRVVGQNMAKEMMLTQRPVKAPELLSLGIANKVVTADELLPTAMQLAKQIAKGPVNGYALSKSLFNQYTDIDFSTMLSEEARLQAVARSDENGVEGLSAFLEKRKPNFK